MIHTLDAVFQPPEISAMKFILNNALKWTFYNAYFLIFQQSCEHPCLPNHNILCTVLLLDMCKHQKD